MTEQVVERGIVLSPKQNALTDWDILKGDKSLFNKRLSLMIANGSRLSESEVNALGAYSLTNDLNPFNAECYYLPGVGPVPGIAGWRRKAHEQLEYEAKQAHRHDPVTIWIDVRQATHAEAMFQDGDIAIHVTLHDSLSKSDWISQTIKLASEMQSLGVTNPWEKAQEVIGAEPTWTGVGVVYKSENFAKEGKPEKFDRIERATKRAEKLAIRKRFQRLHLPEPENYDDAEFNVRVEAPQPPAMLNAGASVESLVGELYGPEAEDKMRAERKQREIMRQVKEIAEVELEELADNGGEFSTTATTETAEEVAPDANVRDYVTWLAESCGLPTSVQSMHLAALLDTILGNSTNRYEFMSYLAGKSVKTSKELPDTRVITALYEWLDPQYDKVGHNYFTENEEAKSLIVNAHTQYLKSIGRMELPEA